jgi:hypothetical protein
MSPEPASQWPWIPAKESKRATFGPPWFNRWLDRVDARGSRRPCVVCGHPVELRHGLWFHATRPGRRRDVDHGAVPRRKLIAQQKRMDRQTRRDKRKRGS